MKLSELVNYYNLMNQDWVSPDFEAAMGKYHAMCAVVTNHHLQFDPQSQDLMHSFTRITSAFSNVKDSLDSFKLRLQQTIELLEPEQYAKSEMLYNNEMCMESPNYIINRRLQVDPDSFNRMKAKLLTLTDWRIPALIIRPGLESFIEHLVPMDPLYLIDQDLDLLQPSVSAFTPEYQRRLRIYTLNDYRDKDPLWQMPDNQFGLIFAWNYFNFKPMSVTVRYLKNIFEKLRPGGTLIFTFNDCDYEQGVLQAENNFMCYTPGRTLIKHSENIGYEFVSRYNGAGDVAWLELKKPGTIQSIRGGQTLAKIVAH